MGEPIADDDAKKAELHDRFKRLEHERIAALNGIGRPRGTAEELERLNRDIIAARAACVEAGLRVESMEEFAQRTRKEADAEVRAFAQEQLKIVPVLPFLRRKLIARVVGVLTALWVAVTWTAPIGALIGGFVAYVVVMNILGDYLPTPATRIARAACQRGADVSDLWPEGSPDREDYERGYRNHRLRMRQRGEDVWIRVS